jgi:hypothetical protein
MSLGEKIVVIIAVLLFSLILIGFALTYRAVL